MTWLTSMSFPLNIEQMKLTFAILGLAACAASARPAHGQAPSERIVITYPSRSIASVDLYIAQERGFFRQEGLLADVVQVRGNIGVTALLSGDAHAINNVGTLIRAMERSDLPAKVMSQSLKKNLFWLVTKPEIKNSPNSKAKPSAPPPSAARSIWRVCDCCKKPGSIPTKTLRW